MTPPVQIFATPPRANQGSARGIAVAEFCLVVGSASPWSIDRRFGLSILDGLRSSTRTNSRRRRTCPKKILFSSSPPRAPSAFHVGLVKTTPYEVTQRVAFGDCSFCGVLEFRNVTLDALQRCVIEADVNCRVAHLDVPRKRRRASCASASIALTRPASFGTRRFRFAASCSPMVADDPFPFNGLRHPSPSKTTPS